MNGQGLIFSKREFSDGLYVYFLGVISIFYIFKMDRLSKGSN